MLRTSPVLANQTTRGWKIAYPRAVADGNPMDLMVSSPDGSGRNRLTKIGTVGLVSCSTPAGRLLFDETGYGVAAPRRIWTVRADGTNLQVLLGVPSPDPSPGTHRAAPRLSSPTWMPDGRSLLYVSTNGDSSELRQHLFGPRPDARDIVVWAGSPGREIRAYQRNPVTGQIAVDTVDNAWPVIRNGSIWVVDPDHPDRTRELVADPAHTYRGATWSPDGRVLGYIGAHNVPDQDPTNRTPAPPGFDHLYLASADGGHPHRISAPGYRDVNSFSWSPDGEALALAGTRVFDGEPRDYIRRLYVGDATGHHLQRLQGHAVKHVWDFTWAPDSSSMLVVRVRDAIGNELWNVPRDGSQPQRLDRGFISSPVWCAQVR